MSGESIVGAVRFPEELRRFVAGERWTFAKTMPAWPHEYLVRERVDRDLFDERVGSAGRVVGKAREIEGAIGVGTASSASMSVALARWC